MKESKNLLAILEELSQDAKQIDQEQLDRVEDLIMDANRVRPFWICSTCIL